MTIKHTLYDTIYDTILKSIDEETIVVTPNRRLSATLHQYYQALQVSLNRKRWHTPEILPISTFFESLWQKRLGQSFKTLPMLLKPIQEQYTWKQIVSNANQSENLIKVTETADLIQTSRKLLREWRVSFEQPIFKSTEDYAALYEWSKQYDELCRANNWIDNAQLPDELIQIKIPLPKNIILYGFTELSPQLQHFFEYSREQGTSVTMIESINFNAACCYFAALNQEHEIYSLAEWAQTIYKTHTDTDVSIACVIPNLDKIRNRVAQIFAEVFNADNSIFNISAGKKLTQYPIIHAVFQILSLIRTSLNADLIWFLLSSPFIGNAEYEQFNRAQFDFWLRERNISVLDIANQTQLDLLAKYCPKLALRLSQILIYLKNLRHRNLYPSEWTQHFNTLLTIMGWPGERSLNSEEFQTVDNWLKLLANFTLLDEVIAQPISITDAIQSLQLFANKHIFQPKSPEAPIQILGVLEAAAMPFDYVWIAGMNDLNWPPQPKPNPFIPKQLQRMLHMPHATAERELLYCQQLLHQFKSSTHHLIFSYAEKTDEMECQSSSLIQDVTNKYLSPSLYQPLVNRIYATKQLEKLTDEIALPINQNEKLRGGVNIINYQALCPFRAFGEWRLYAKNLQERKLGMRAIDRGTIMHKLLEFIWRHLKDHHTLMSLSDKERNQLIDEAVEQTIRLVPISVSSRKRYMMLEKQRLHKLVTHWLDIEKAREPFDVIATEKSMQLTLEHINIDIKIDRIDQLANGAHLIIDYKTGKYNDINQWFDERPTEIQLPLYALINKQKTYGISFAQITSGYSGFKGVSQHSLDIKGIKPYEAIKKSKSATNWQTQLLQWQTIFNQLSKDFYCGVAKVDPKDGEKTCTFCNLKSLCRLHDEVNCGNA